MLKKFRSIDDDDDMADYHEYGSEARTQESEHGLRHCPHARKGNPLSDLPTFKMTVLCTTYSLVLHFIVEIWRVTVATATQIFRQLER